MVRPARDRAELKAQKRRAAEWRSFRSDYNLTRPELADRLGISLRTVESVECAERTPRMKTIRFFLTLKTRFAGCRIDAFPRWETSNDSRPEAA